MAYRVIMKFKNINDEPAIWTAAIFANNSHIIAFLVSLSFYNSDDSELPFIWKLLLKWNTFIYCLNFVNAYNNKIVTTFILKFNNILINWDAVLL